MGLKPLEFSDCLLDSPYFRDSIHDHEKELDETNESIKNLIKECRNLIKALECLSKAQQGFSSQLRKFKLRYIGEVDADDDLEYEDAFPSFAYIIEKIEEERDRMLTHAKAQLIDPLENFRREQIGRAKVKRMIKSKYVHLKEHHQMLWCRFISQQIELFPNICMLLEILLVMLASSSMVERGFSTLRRILRENRLSMKNDRLNQTLIVRCNLPILKKLRIDCVDKIINDAVELYLVKKKWRWGIRQQKQNKEKVQDLKSIYGCPPKKRKRIDMSKTPDTTDEIVVSSSSGEDSESESESENELENFSSDDGSDSSASDSSADGIRMNVE